MVGPQCNDKMAFLRTARTFVLAAALALSGCAQEAAGPVEGFGGLVAADEPNAAVVGREVLGNGGTAADAAVAMAFALTVTYPSRAGLAGGGACLAYDFEKKSTDALVFLPTPGATGTGTLPLMPRAMAALNALHGSLRWELLVSPAENLARFGHDMSRALAQDFAVGGQTLLSDPEAQAIWAPAGRVETGVPIVQAQLATTLAALRQQGAGYFHSSTFITRYVEATTAIGLPVDGNSLRGAVPQLLPPVRLQVGDRTVWFTPPPDANGLLSAELYMMISQMLNAGGDARGEVLHLFLEASAQAFADRAGWLGPGGTSTIPADQVLDESRLRGLAPDLGQGNHRAAASLHPTPEALIEPAGGTGFVAGDRYGNAVACSFTMNGLFGSGRMAPGTGMVMAASPPGYLSVSPVAVLVASEGSGRFYFAGAGGDGAAAATSVARVLFEVLDNKVSLAEAMELGRVHHNGLPDVAFAEERIPIDLLQALTQRGHDVRTLPAMGLVNAFWCPDSLPKGSSTCQVESDSRGFGLTQRAE
jgi:gamma-glutamyltranspeptidase/glutathione hydrolase